MPDNDYTITIGGKPTESIPTDKDYTITIFPSPSEVASAKQTAENLKQDILTAPPTPPVAPAELPVQETDTSSQQKQLIDLLNKEAGYTPPQSEDATPSFSQGAPSPWYRRFTAPEQGKIQNVLSIAKQTGQRPSDAMDDYENFVSNVRQNPEFLKTVMPGLMIGSMPILWELGVAPSTMLADIGIFAGLDEASNLGVSLAKKEPYQFGASKGLSDLAGKDISDRAKTVFDTVDFIGKAALASSGKPILETLKSQTWFRKLTNRERGLVVLNTVNNMKSQGYTEASMDNIVSGMINGMKQSGYNDAQIIRQMKTIGGEKADDFINSMFNYYVKGKTTIPKPPSSDASIDEMMSYIKKYGETTTKEQPSPVPPPQPLEDMLTKAENQLDVLEGKVTPKPKTPAVEVPTVTPPVEPIPTPPVAEEPTITINDKKVKNKYEDKEIWEIPKNEWINIRKKYLDNIDVELESNSHEWAVADAYGQGNKIPKNVLKDYPNIKNHPQYIEEINKTNTPIENIVVEKPTETETVISTDIPVEEKKSLSYKEQKKYLLSEIDKAYENATIENIEPADVPPSETSYSNVGGVIKENIETAQIAMDQYRSNQEKYGTVTIEVPDDGTFTILNTKKNIEEFKARVNANFPSDKRATKPTGIKLPKPTGKRQIFEEGVEYYNPFQVYKQDVVVEPKAERHYYGEGIYSDGYYFVKSEKPTKIKTELLPKDKIESAIKLYEGDIPAKIIAQVQDNQYNTLKIAAAHVVDNEGKSTYYNAKYIDAILTKHPNAKPFVNSDRMALTFKDKDEIVGLVMSIIQNDDTHLMEQFNKRVNPETLEFYTEDELKAKEVPVAEEPTITIGSEPIQTQPQEQPTPTSYGDVGGYANIPPKVPPLNEMKDKAYSTIPQIVRMPEIVEFGKELLGGKYPRVMKRIRGLAVGRFIPKGEGRIEVEAQLAKDPIEMSKVLAHEIGHLVDYLPDQVIKRGNVLGHIAALKRFMRTTLPQYPGAGTTISEKDRVRLRNLAKKLLSQKEIEIDEEIVTETPVTPDDILSLWRDSDVEIKKRNPQLYEYISKLTNKEKKSIVKEAMKNIVPAKLKQFVSISREYTGRKITKKYEPSKAEIRAKYQELINEEVKKRALYTLEDMNSELRDFTMKWKPFDSAINEKYTKYRYSPQELYADAFSALMTNPQFLQDNAPHFYEAFFNYIDERPQVKKEWDALQNLLKSGEQNKVLSMRIREGFQQWEHEMSQGVKSRAKAIFSRDEWGALMVDQFYSVLRHIRNIGESNIPADLNPRYAIERMQLSGSRDEGYLSEIHRNILDRIKNDGIELTDLNEYVFYKRVAGQRAETANPFGVTPDIAKERMDELRTQLGEELDKYDDEFRKIRQEWFMDRVVSAGVHDQELLDKMQEHIVDYARFDVIGHLERKYGRVATSHIYNSVGTFNPIGPPITGTLLHDISIMHSVNINIMKRTTDDFFKTYYPELRETAKPDRFNGRFMEFSESKDPSKGLVVYLKNGKLVGAYYPKPIANALKSGSIEMAIYGDTLRALSGAMRIGSAPFKSLFTGKNPGFMLVNAPRDFLTTIKQVPGMSARNFIGTYIESIPEAFASAFGKEMSPTVKTLLKNNALISVANFKADSPDDVEIDRMLKRVGIIASHHKTLGTETNEETMTMLKKVISEIYELSLEKWDQLERIGAAVERIPKIAGYKWLQKNKPEMSNEEKYHYVRTLIGSPPFMRRAITTPLIDPIFLYINAYKEGWRSSFEAMRNDPYDYGKKTFIWNILPKLLFYGAATGIIGYGAMDDDQRKEFSNKLVALTQRVSKYDRVNYNLIPVGFDKNGEAIYIRMVQDPSGQALGGIVTLAIEKNMKEMIPSIFGYVGGQVPSLNPLLGVLWAAKEYAAGNNPYDFFRGEHVIDDKIFSAGGMMSHKAFAKWIANQLGGGIVYRFDTYDAGQEKSAMKKVLNMPVISNTAGRFVKVTDIGISQSINDDLKKLQQLKDKTTVMAYSAVNKMVNGENPTDEEKQALVEKYEQIATYVNKALAKKYGNVYMRRFMLANTNDEKMIILEHMMNDPIMSEAFKK